jgi:hypothetical protein
MDADVHTKQPMESPLERSFARGHRERKGHEQVIVLVSLDGYLWHRVRLCCGETVEQRAAELRRLAPKENA